jgi:hypothetical protein
MIIVPDKFHELARGNVIPLENRVAFAWSKQKADDVSFFTLDQSMFDGSDIMQGDTGNDLQLWDTYEYVDITDRIVSIEYERSIDFPYFAQLAQADIVLNNFDGYFDPDSNSAIGAYANTDHIPLRIWSGYQSAGVVPQFVGITDGLPQYDNNSRTVKYHAMDFMSAIFAMDLTDFLIMQNVRTDKVLRALFLQFGLTETQFNLAAGSNTIPFVFFDAGSNAGDVIRKLMTAEMGRLWLDEQGIIRFTSRNEAFGAAVAVLDDYQVISVKSGAKDDRINRIRVPVTVRDVQEWQTVYSKSESGDSTSNLWVVAPNLPYTISLSIDDPCLDILQPVLGKNSAVSWFTCKDANGNPVTSGVTVSSIELRSDSYKLTFSNSNIMSIEIDELELWGEPAKIVNKFTYEAKDDSWDESDDRLFSVDDDNFLSTLESARAFAQFVFAKYSNKIPTIEATIKGNFAQQLGDTVNLDLDSVFAGDWEVNSIAYKISVGSLATTIKANFHETYNLFILDISELNGPDLLGF